MEGGNNQKKRVSIRLAPDDFAAMERLARDYGLLSPSALLQYFARCCLRRYRSEPDVPDGVFGLFVDTVCMDRALIAQAVRNIEHRKRSGRPRPKDIGDEISEMFSNYEEEGKKKMFADDIRKRR